MVSVWQDTAKVLKCSTIYANALFRWHCSEASKLGATCSWLEKDTSS